MIYENVNFTWTSSDPSIAYVNKSGNVRGKSCGTATIICSDEAGRIKATCKVTVAIKVKFIRIPEKLELVAGTKGKLTATLTPSDTSQTGKTWTSSDNKVATVDKYGNVTAVGRGTATITCTSKADSSIKDTCKVLVMFMDATRYNVSAGLFKAINWISNQKITGEKITFGTNNSMTRGQFVRFLYRYAGEPEVTDSMITKHGSRFTDVDSNYTHFKAIVWAISKGLIAGYSDNTFKPNDPLTKNNVATILWKFGGKKKVDNITYPFTDIPSSSPIAWEKEAGIFTGTKFEPTTNCLRGDFALFLYRYDRYKN